MDISVYEEDTVAKQRQDDEEDGEDHALVVDSSLGLDAVIHHHVPVLTGQDLGKTKTQYNRSM